MDSQAWVIFPPQLERSLKVVFVAAFCKHRRHNWNQGLLPLLDEQVRLSKYRGMGRGFKHPDTDTPTTSSHSVDDTPTVSGGPSSSSAT